VSAVPCLVLAVLALAQAASAAVTAGARIAPQSVAVGEPADLAVVVQGTQQAAVPAIPPVDGLRVDYVGPETQIAIVNGQTTASVTHHFTVVPQRAGTFTVGPITVNAEGRTLAAGVVTLRVAQGSAGGAGPEAELTVRLSVPRTAVYLGERVPVRIELRVGAVQVTDVSYPRILGDGFSLEPFGEPTQREEQQATIVEFRTAVTPARAGSLTLGPAVLPLAVLRPRAQRRSFFGGSVRQQVELRSEALALEVLPLPAEGRPAEFSGAVGRFTITARAAPTELAAGDPVTVTMDVRGEGALGAAMPGGVPASETFRVYPVQPATRQPEVAPGVVHRIFEQVVIPQRPGPATLPPLAFAFFDPEARAYRTATHPPIALVVRDSAGRSDRPQIVGSESAPPERAEPLGRDLVSIKDAPGQWRALGAARWRSAAFWIGQLPPLVVLVLVAVWDRRRQRDARDPARLRVERARRMAHDDLAAARRALAAGDRSGCYDAIARALTGYLAAWLDLAPGSVTPEEVVARLRAAGVSPPTLDDARSVLAACEETRFAPRGSADADAARTIAQAEAVIRACQRTRSRAPRARAAAALVAIGLAASIGATRAAESPEALFYRGNTLYGEGRFAEAAASYLAARAQGRTSAALEYNLGTAWAKAGETGRAILAYERARRLAPRDPDLLANLSFVRPQAAEVLPAWWQRIVFPLGTRWTTDELLLVSAIAWWVGCLTLAASRLAAVAARPLRLAALVAACLLVLAGSSAAWRAARIDARAWAVVTATTPVTVRFEPTPSGTAHFEAAPGTLLVMQGERGDWAQVERGDGLRGWVERSAIEPI